MNKQPLNRDLETSEVPQPMTDGVSTNFPISTTTAAALVEVEPCGLRELHWHPNNDEWQYYLAGQGRMTVFASGGKARTFDYQAGDVGYVPFAMGHYIENTGDTPLRFLEMFRSERFADVSLNQLMPKESRPRGLRNGAPSAAAMDNRKQRDRRLGLATSSCQSFRDPSPRINAPTCASVFGSM